MSSSAPQNVLEQLHTQSADDDDFEIDLDLDTTPDKYFDESNPNGYFDIDAWAKEIADEAVNGAFKRLSKELPATENDDEDVVSPAIGKIQDDSTVAQTTAHSHAAGVRNPAAEPSKPQATSSTNVPANDTPVSFDHDSEKVEARKEYHDGDGESSGQNPGMHGSLSRFLEYGIGRYLESAPGCEYLGNLQLPTIMETTLAHNGFVLDVNVAIRHGNDPSTGINFDMDYTTVLPQEQQDYVREAVPKLGKDELTEGLCFYVKQLTSLVFSKHHVPTKGTCQLLWAIMHRYQNLVEKDNEEVDVVFPESAKPISGEGVLNGAESGPRFVTLIGDEPQAVSTEPSLTAPRTEPDSLSRGLSPEDLLDYDEDTEGEEEIATKEPDAIETVADDVADDPIESIEPPTVAVKATETSATSTPVPAEKPKKECIWVNRPGGCKDGDDCKFAHTNKGVKCKFLEECQQCRYGSTCMFVHPPTAQATTLTTPIREVTRPLPTAVDTKKRKCTWVNKPSGCKSGDLCAFDHSHQGVVCKYTKDSKPCPDSFKCIFVHQETQTVTPPATSRRPSVALSIPGTPTSPSPPKRKCTWVNKPASCKHGSECVFDHSHEGVECTYAKGGNSCPAGFIQCPFKHPSKEDKPVSRASSVAPDTPNSPNNSGPRFKEILCKSWERNGECSRGDACWYSHDPTTTTPVGSRSPSPAMSITGGVSNGARFQPSGTIATPPPDTPSGPRADRGTKRPRNDNGDEEVTSEEPEAKQRRTTGQLRPLTERITLAIASEGITGAQNSSNEVPHGPRGVQRGGRGRGHHVGNGRGGFSIRGRGSNRGSRGGVGRGGQRGGTGDDFKIKGSSGGN